MILRSRSMRRRNSASSGRAPCFIVGQVAGENEICRRNSGRRRRNQLLSLTRSWP